MSNINNPERSEQASYEPLEKLDGKKVDYSVLLEGKRLSGIGTFYLRFEKNGKPTLWINPVELKPSRRVVTNFPNFLLSAGQSALIVPNPKFHPNVWNQPEYRLFEP